MSNQQANSLLFKYKLFSKFFLEYKLETFVVNENVRLQIRYRSQGKDTRPKVERTFIILLACSELNFIMSQGCRKRGDRWRGWAYALPDLGKSVDPMST